MEINGFIINPQSGSAGVHDIDFSITAVNEGIDKSIEIDAVCGNATDKLTLVHEGKRQQFKFSDGSILRMSDGGRFAVLKPVPEVPQFEKIEFVTFDGTTIFDTGIYGNERISIETEFQRSDIGGAPYLFGCSSGNRLTAYLTQSGYWRYGTGYPTFNTNNKNKTYAKVTPGMTTVGSSTKTFSTSKFTTEFTIPVGGHKPSSGTPTPQFKGYLWYFKIWIGDELVLDWIPMRRVIDGVEGFWDNVSQTFIEKV